MRAIAAALALALLAGGARAQVTRDPPISGEALAAMAMMRDGQVVQGRLRLEQLAKAGDAGAAEGLGEILWFGLGATPRDPKAACANFAMAEGQRGDATHNVALCAEQGVLGASDPARATQLYERAADLGYQKSKCALGNLLISGKGVAKDVKRGVALCREAAEAGVADAQADVGDQYLMGEVVPRDVAAARRWYELAAAQKQANAAFLLAQIYWNADGVPRDLAKCQQYLVVAFEGGRKDAALWLGNVAWVRAQRGEKTWDPDGLQEAHDWYDKASDSADAAVKKQATEGRDLALQLKEVMLRTHPAR
jgi:uncharacterized protein